MNHNKNVLIIAEAGVNHNGNLDLAYKMVDEAKKAGADIIKFQTAHADDMISKCAEKANYQKNTTDASESQLEMIRRLMLPFEDFPLLKAYCQKKGIGFLSTPFEIGAIRFLNELQDIWKIPSGEITNYPYLVEIGKTGKQVIMSTGMSTIYEIQDAIDVLLENGCGEISLLHCNTQYPTPFEDANLRAMLTLKEKFDCSVGYSDHTPGIEASIAAVALGADIIEKHFTLDKNMEGPDHKASLEPYELFQMISSIRHIEMALGTGEKVVTNSESENVIIARKSIVAKKDISKGEMFTTDNLTTKRPGNGISAMNWEEVLGKTAICDFRADELIRV